MSDSLASGKIDELRAQLKLNLEWARVGSEDLLRDYRKQRKATQFEGKPGLSSPDAKSNAHHSGQSAGPSSSSTSAVSSAHTIVPGQSLTLSEMRAQRAANLRTRGQGYASESGISTPRTVDETGSLKDYYSDDDWQTPFEVFSYQFRTPNTPHGSKITWSLEERQRADFMRTIALREDYLRHKRLERKLQQLERKDRERRKDAIDRVVETSLRAIQRQQERKQAAIEAAAAQPVRQHWSQSILASLTGGPAAGQGAADSKDDSHEPKNENGENGAPAGDNGETDGDNDADNDGDAAGNNSNSAMAQKYPGASAKDRKRHFYALQWQRQERLTKQQQELEAAERKKREMIERREKALLIDVEAKRLLANQKLESRIQKKVVQIHHEKESFEASSPLKQFVSKNERYLSPEKKRGQAVDEQKKTHDDSEEIAAAAAAAQREIEIQRQIEVESARAAQSGPSATQQAALAYIEEGSEMLRYLKAGSNKTHKRYFKVSTQDKMLSIADKKSAKRWKNVLIVGVTPKVDVPLQSSLMARSFTIKNVGDEGDIMLTATDDQMFALWMEGLDYLLSAPVMPASPQHSVQQSQMQHSAGGTPVGNAHGQDIAQSTFESEDGAVLSDDQRVDMLMAFVSEGSQLLKYTKGGKGKPHSRFFKMDPDKGRILWADTKLSKKWRKGKVVGLLRGVNRKVMGDADVHGDLERRAFTVKISEGEDLVLVAPTIDMVQRWTDAVEIILDSMENKQQGASFADRALRALWGFSAPDGEKDDDSDGSAGSGDTVAESVYAASVMGERNNNSNSELKAVTEGSYISKFTRNGKGKPHPRFVAVKMPECALTWAEKKADRNVRKAFIQSVAPYIELPNSLLVKCTGKAAEVVLVLSSGSERDMWMKGLLAALRTADRSAYSASQLADAGADSDDESRKSGRTGLDNSSGANSGPAAGSGLTPDALQRHNVPASSSNASGPAMPAPPSKFVFESWAEKRTKGGKGKPHRRWFYADREMPILRWRDSAAASTKSERRVQYSGVEVCDPSTNGGLETELLITLVNDDDGTLQLLCRDAAERNSWYQLMKAVLDRFAANGGHIGGMADADQRSMASVRDNDAAGSPASNAGLLPDGSKRRKSVFVRSRAGSVSSNSGGESPVADNKPGDLADDCSDDLVRCRLFATRGCEAAFHLRKGKGKPQRKVVSLDDEAKRLFLDQKKGKYMQVTQIRQGIRHAVPTATDEAECKSLTVMTFGDSDTVFLEFDSVIVMRAWLLVLTNMLDPEAGAAMAQKNAERLAAERAATA